MTDGPSHLPGLYVIGSRLREFRDNRGISLRQLAVKLGFNPSTVSGWETGARPLDVGQLGWYLGYLQVTPAEYQLMMRLHGQAERASHIENLAPGEASLQDVYLRYAVHTYEWAPRVVPDFLQTSEYAHAVLGRTSQPDDVDLEILTRQVRQVDRNPHHRHTVLLGAAALNHEFLSAEIRDAQLQHLTTSATGRISTQLVPDSLSVTGTTELGLQLLGVGREDDLPARRTGEPVETGGEDGEALAGPGGSFAQSIPAGGHLGGQLGGHLLLRRSTLHSPRGCRLGKAVRIDPPRVVAQLVRHDQRVVPVAR